MSANKRFVAAISAVLSLLAMPGYGADSVAAPGQRGAATQHAGHGEAAGKGRSAAWTAFPVLKIRMSGESRERRVVMVVPQGMAAGRIDAYSNNAEDAEAHRQLPLEMAGARLDKPESGGFHWLAAREEQGGTVRVASTVNFSSERGAQNPTAMFMRQKHELEIIPQPYPREHSRYRANENWKFMVRFNGQPLAGQKVHMETANGSKAELVSDAQGMVTLAMPDDFRNAENKTGAHDHGRRSADFVLATEHAEGGRNYLTAFNASYGTDAFDQRSLALGLGFTLLGMIGAAPLLRQRKTAKTGAETIKNEDA